MLLLLFKKTLHRSENFFYNSGSSRVKEETSVSALIERRHYQKSKTIGHAALKPKFFKELCEKANDILITRTKQIERVSQWKRTEERETQWYDLSDISDFELDSPRL